MSLNSTSLGVCLYHTHLPCSPLISAHSFPQAESCWDKQEQREVWEVHCHNTAQEKAALGFISMPLMLSHVSPHSKSLSWEHSSADTCHCCNEGILSLVRKTQNWGCVGNFRSHLSSSFVWKTPEGILQFVTLKHKPDHPKCWAKGINLLLQRFMARQTLSH